MYGQAGLSSFGDSFQPVCEERGTDERYAAGEGRRALDDDRQPHLDMILGKSGRLPGILAPEIVELASPRL